VGIVAETNGDPLVLATPSDVNLGRAVNHDVVDRLVGQQRLQRTEAGHVIGQIACHPGLFGTGQLHLPLVGDLVDEPLDLALHRLGRHGRRGGGIKLLEHELA
jgi:hypothetical protein